MCGRAATQSKKTTPERPSQLALCLQSNVAMTYGHLRSNNLK
jgi:hypothetical protein